MRWGITASLVIGVLLWAPGLRSQQGLGEYQVKAAFLFNFGKFVEWPEGSFLSDGAPFSICVLGDDPFHGAVDALHGKFIGHRPVEVWRIKDAQAGFRCQIVFVSESEKGHLQAIFSALRGSNALLVGETEGFAASGGAIQFVVEDNRVRFAINPDAIRRAGLQVSSRLLALAEIVQNNSSASKASLPR